MSTTTDEREMRSLVLRLLGEIAPEADTASLQPDVSFRDQLDLDSMDFLNFVVALHKEFHIEIPEADYPKYMTLNGCLAQLTAPRT
ncbi:MAG: Acyl carrier protein [Nitrospira sp.]|jgi:acyl carrier protein|nr:MAG: Acyl carrier protein [Nitrospira sp.]